ncbi:siphovirus ReqiPepy6 Gp37-like family protein [Ruminococcus sp.]|uniref:siphovirus ReqiPepy6 Gp37-like family protein n=1 Tax=Ruminococcus sp. TaxID=41978 RepID=UPI0025DC0E43|nr:siphovirus ReqiPepy6 Gp37-like family protein [Ruminococcus sp.]
MQIEIYNMQPDGDTIVITLEAICDSFSSLIWDVEYYKCGSFEVYIAANPLNISTFRTGRIVGRDDDKEHFGIIESVQIDTDTENGDYLTVRGRFLMCLLERRIIHPTLSITKATAYSDIVRTAVTLNTIHQDKRRIPGLSLGDFSGTCWEKTVTLQISYANLMEWVYTICEKIGGTANIRLVKNTGEQYRMVFDLYEGSDRSIMQQDNPHIIFSDTYSNLLSFSYAEDASVERNFAYIFGQGNGDERKRTTYYNGNEPSYLYRYEVYVDADDISETEDVNGETVPISEDKYIELLKTRGSEQLVQPKTVSESEIATNNTQYQYNKDYAVGDYVTVQHKRFGMIQPKIQLIGMIECFDCNGRSLTPTFKKEEQ